METATLAWRLLDKHRVLWDADRMLGIMRVVLACGLYHEIETHGDACATDIEIHSDSVKHSLLGLLSFYGRDGAPFGTSPAVVPISEVILSRG